MKAYYHNNDESSDSGHTAASNTTSTTTGITSKNKATMESKFTFSDDIKNESFSSDKYDKSDIVEREFYDSKAADNEDNRRDSLVDRKDRKSIDELVELLNGANNKEIMTEKNKIEENKIVCDDKQNDSQLFTPPICGVDTKDNYALDNNSGSKILPTMSSTTNSINHNDQYQPTILSTNDPMVSSSSIPIVSAPSIHLLDVSINGIFDLLGSSPSHHRMFGCYVSYYIKDSVNDNINDNLVDTTMSGNRKNDGKPLKRQLLWWDSDKAVLNSSNRHRIHCNATTSSDSLSSSSSLSMDDVCEALGFETTNKYIEFTLHACDEDGMMIDDNDVDGGHYSGSSSGGDGVLGTSLLPFSDIYSLLNTSGSTTTYTLPIVFIDSLTSSPLYSLKMMDRSKHVMQLTVSHRIEPILLLNKSIDMPTEQIHQPSSLPLQNHHQFLQMYRH